ncbi:MAG: hypothetical protein HW391_1343 [Chloroflexi bacterium]|nr:hypothetical protein [Chloroflexota bacterium]
MRSPSVRRRLLAFSTALAVAVGLGAPAAASAHPLGNFTINHYAALRVGPDRIDLDVVVDFAEIPAFQERVRIDADADGTVTVPEADAARDDECDALRPSLDLRIDDVRVDLALQAAGLSFPAGAGGVPTMRVVCEFAAAAPDPSAAASIVTFADTSYTERIGWREIVVIGDRMVVSSLDGGPAPTATDVSARLTQYPASLLAQPLDVRSVRFSVAPGGPAAEAFIAPDAGPLNGAATPATPAPSASGGGAGPAASPSPGSTTAPAVVPGGVGAEIPDIFRVADLTPLIALGSILLAMALGAGHALTPGHGKTLMAAYLVGTRGTVRHAAGLGLAVRFPSWPRSPSSRSGRRWWAARSGDADAAPLRMATPRHMTTGMGTQTTTGTTTGTTTRTTTRLSTAMGVLSTATCRRRTGPSPGAASSCWAWQAGSSRPPTP